MLTDVLAFFSEAGINLPQFLITFDSWYGLQLLREVLAEKESTAALPQKCFHA
jgi:hypothetical protein